MFGYYLDLALRSLKRNKVLTALMIVAIGLGIGASMTMLTVLHVMSADPIPGRSAKLFYPQVDPQGMDNYTKGEEPLDQLTWIDAMNLLHAHQVARQVAMTGGYVTVRPPQGNARAFFERARYTTADFFSMFEVPMLHGHAWTASDDANRARVAVIGRDLADKLFGADHAIGQSLHLGKDFFRIIGVTDHWRPVPRFYDLTTGNYAKAEQIFLPLQTALSLKQPWSGNLSCWGDSGMPSSSDMRKAADCTWMQLWVQLDTPAQVTAYRQFLVNYSEQQKALGRFARPPNTRLRDVMGWLAHNDVIPGSVQLQGLLALGFMLVCLLNVVALLLVKFLRRGGELSVRRAMGASKRAVFAQLLIEASLIGISGGVVGLLLALFGLWVVRQQPANYASLAHLDLPMLGTTLVLALVATVLAGVFPAWRACHLPPARALKTQ